MSIATLEHPGDVDRWIPVHRPDTPPLDDFDPFPMDPLNDWAFATSTTMDTIDTYSKLLDDPCSNFDPGFIWDQGLTPPASPPRSSSPPLSYAPIHVLPQSTVTFNETQTPNQIPPILPETPAVYHNPTLPVPIVPKARKNRATEQPKPSKARAEIARSNAGKSSVVVKVRPAKLSKASVAKTVAATVMNVVTAPATSLVLKTAAAARRSSVDSESDASGSRRASHNVLERKRRSDLKFNYQVLRDHIPDLVDNDRVPTAHILEAAVTYIKQLQEQSKDGTSRLAMLRASNKKLRARAALNAAN